MYCFHSRSAIGVQHWSLVSTETPLKPRFQPEAGNATQKRLRLKDEHSQSPTGNETI
ncbi:hypothetical protein [Nostoc sp.]|uniref:hypothetical protein n=1 Tax=Nostoc sp. TaxID=1180 RepID=UPI002FF66546